MHRKYMDIKGVSGSNIVDQVTQQNEHLRSRMEKIKYKVAVISGKALQIGQNGVFPAVGPLNIKVMSMDLLLPTDETPVEWDAPTQRDTFIWRSTMEVSTLRKFVSDTEWGELNSLFIDLPAGVEKFPNVAQLLTDLDGVVLVTIPTEVSHFVVKKSAVTAKALGTPVFGVIENMVGYICPNCGEAGELFKTVGGKKMANQMGVPYLGSIPFDPRISIASDKGVPFVLEYSDSSAGRAFLEISEKINGFLGRNE